MHVDCPDDSRAIDELTVEVKTLFAVDEFGLDAIHRLEDDTETIHGVVDAQIPLLIGTKDEATSKLIVEVANGDIDAPVVVFVARKAVP